MVTITDELNIIGSKTRSDGTTHGQSIICKRLLAVHYIFLPFAQYFFSIAIKTRSKSYFVSYLVYSLNIVVKCAYLGNDFIEYERTFFKII